MKDKVTLRQGTYIGKAFKGGVEYLGIPFAKPPLGELTFAAPLPLDPSHSTYKAQELRENPIQATNDDQKNYSKDCLYLNVRVPDHKEGEKLPVMVWIYGGSYAEGGSGKGHLPSFGKASRCAYFNTHKLSSDTRTIQVTFNYRVNLYGFLNLHYLNGNIPTNLGMLDQIMALKWVKENIAAFDGDTDNITVYGESAGGACILALMTSPLAQGLFNKAIVQSACIDHFYSEKESERITRRYIRYLGLQEKDISKLYDLSPEKIMKANTRLEKSTIIRGDTRCAFSPVIDGITVSDYPRNVAFNSSIPLLIGTLEREASRFTYGNSALIMHAFMLVSHQKARKGKENYKERVVKTLTENMYKEPLRAIVSRYKGLCYVYNLTCNSPYMEQRGINSCHATDLYLLFDEIDNAPFFEGNKDKARELSSVLKQYWGSFAYSGKPDLEWKPYHTEKDIFQIK